MRSVYAVGLVVIAALTLVFCDYDSDDEGADNPNNGDAEYALEAGGIVDNVTIGSVLNITVQIMYGDKLVTENDAAITQVLLEIKCADHQVVEQQKAAVDGIVSFAAINVTGDNFTGDCTATVSADLAGQQVSADYEFKAIAEAPITLPPLPNGTNPSDGGDTIPTVSMQAIVGRTVAVTSPVALKVQPDDLCDRNLALIYYDAQNNVVREVLTAGEHIAPVNGVVLGLALVKAQADVDIASACQSKGDNSPTPSVVIAATPGFPKGLRLPVAAAANEPSLGSASFSNAGGKIKLSWETVNNFGSSAEVFFNNATEGNEWTRHTGSTTWSADGSVTSTLDHTLPVKALVKVSFSDGGTHWLYFSKRS